MERVLVVENDFLMDFLSNREGLIFISEVEALSILGRAFFMDRDAAEHDERYRQVIPYITFVDGDKVLLMRRTKRQSEKRLHDLYTIGIGGHINEWDGDDPIEAFKNGMKREIEEEVDVSVNGIEFIGIINSLENEVSRVHVGYFYMAFGRFIDVKEKENFEWKLVPIDEISEYEGGMEGWSKIALAGLRYRLMRS